MTERSRVLVHFGREHVSTYSRQDGLLALLGREPTKFRGGLTPEPLARQVNRFCDRLGKSTEEVNNENTWLYATGLFQQLSQVDTIRLISRIYVHSGLRLNIVGDYSPCGG